MKYRSKIGAFFVLNFFFFSTSLQAVVIPSDRIVNWQPGIPGGIPVYPVGVNVKDYGAKGDGVTDDAAAILNAVAACPSGRAVLLPAGVYNVSTELLINKSIVLRGEGPDKTFIRSYGGTGSIISLSITKVFLNDIPVISGYERGSTALTVSNASNINVGDFIQLIETADPDMVGQPMSWCESQWGYRAINQYIEVAAKQGNMLTLKKALYYDFKLAYNPRLQAKLTPLGAGVEDLSVERKVSAGSHNIRLANAVRCWIKNVHSKMTRKWHVQLADTAECEIRDSFFEEGWDHGGDASYGVGMFTQNTDNLVENNIFKHLRHSMVYECGSSGNVYGYNYSVEPWGDAPNIESANWLMTDMLFHGGGAAWNLFEGNKVSQMRPDDIFNSGSPHNTFFRNRATGKSVPQIKFGLISAWIEINNRYENVVGNVLQSVENKGNSNAATLKIGDKCCGTTAYDPLVLSTLLQHNNFDMLTGSTQLDSSITDQDLPNSLYLPSKPSWYGSFVWPPYGPDRTPMDNVLPAQARYENSPPPITPPTPPSVNTAAPSVVVLKNLFRPIRNEEANVQINLAADGPVVVKILDRRGTEVRRLMDEDQKAGPVSVSWDGKNTDGRMVTSGVYMVLIEANGRTESKKVVVVK